MSLLGLVLIWIIINLVSPFTINRCVNVHFYDSKKLICSRERTFKDRMSIIWFLFVFKNSILFSVQNSYNNGDMYRLYKQFKLLNGFGKFVFLCNRESIIHEDATGHFKLQLNMTGIVFMFKFVIFPAIPLVNFIILLYHIVFLSHYRLSGEYDITQIAMKKEKGNNNLSDIYK